MEYKSKLRYGVIALLAIFLLGCATNRTIFFEGRGVKVGQTLTVHIRSDAGRQCRSLGVQTERGCASIGGTMIISEPDIWTFLHELAHYFGYNEKEAQALVPEATEGR